MAPMLRAREKPQSALGLGPSGRDTAALAQVLAAEPPHYHEHRMRLRARFLEAGAQALAPSSRSCRRRPVGWRATR
jgi:hypothetical protein